MARGKEIRRFGDREYCLELPIHCDVVLIKARRSDRLGNLTYRETARSFTPVMAAAAKLTIAQVDEIVPVGAIPPETVVTPRIYVDRVVACPRRPDAEEGYRGRSAE